MKYMFDYIPFDLIPSIKLVTLFIDCGCFDAINQNEFILILYSLPLVYTH